MDDATTEAPPFEHEHDPKTGRELPPFAELWRGLVLLAVAMGSLLLAGRLAARHPLLALPAWLPLLGGAILAAWSGLIHVTGGEKFADHPDI